MMVETQRYRKKQQQNKQEKGAIKFIYKKIIIRQMITYFQIFSFLCRALD